MGSEMCIRDRVERQRRLEDDVVERLGRRPAVGVAGGVDGAGVSMGAVSYTHLTLPTSDLV